MAGWPSIHLDLASLKRPGELDAVYETKFGPVEVLEWETGNIASSHRALLQ